VQTKNAWGENVKKSIGLLGLWNKRWKWKQ